MSLESLAQARIRVLESDQLEEVTPTLETTVGTREDNEADAVSLKYHVSGRDFDDSNEQTGSGVGREKAKWLPVLRAQ